MPSSNTARLIFAALLLMPHLALAQAQDAATYDRCLALARKDPAEGFETGSSWRDHGGGVPAEHCVAIALVGLKQYGEAADRLEKLAAKMVRESDTLRAEVLSQAAEAWSEAGKPQNAEADLTEAIKLVPKDAADYLVNRAAARAQRQDYKEAVDDLNKALAKGPRADALAYRASAWRYLNDLKQARADAEAAVKLDPGLVAGWLELGNIKRLAQDDAGARKAWLKVIELAPDSPGADDARDNIAELDVHIDNPPPAAK